MIWFCLAKMGSMLPISKYIEFAFGRNCFPNSKCADGRIIDYAEAEYWSGIFNFLFFLLFNHNASPANRVKKILNIKC
jgi:hypothetical protein